MRQDSTLERYDDAKPILDAEYQKYRYGVELMPITKWLAMVADNYEMRPPPPPAPIPYWPCNMVLTEQRQTPTEKPHSPQGYHNGWEQKKPAAKKPQRRRQKVAGTHVESPAHWSLRDETSLPISHLIGHQTRSQTVPPSAGLLHASTHHQVRGTAGDYIQCPDFSCRYDSRRRPQSRH